MNIENYFIDEATIKIKGGNGGNGIISFRREKYVDKGGPSGGNGGNGGNVYMVSDSNINTLIFYKGNSKFVGNKGSDGGSKNQSGANGEDIILKVPVGTEILDSNKKILFDFNKGKQKFLVSSGGAGGKGNTFFKSSANSVPYLYENGSSPNLETFYLNLKIIADVGVIGYPNVGKSTFVSTISNAKPKISNYEFTTLSPILGVVKHNGFDFTISDLPGLIEGASENKGLGHKFLKHIQRVKFILHFIDSTSDDLLKKYKSIRNELNKYSSKLHKKEEIIVFSKIDLIPDREMKKIFELFKFLGEKNLFFLSSIEKKGVNEILSKVVLILKSKKNDEMKVIDEKSEDFVYIKYKEKNDLKFYFEKNSDGEYFIYGPLVEYWVQKIPLTTNDNKHRFFRKIFNKNTLHYLNKKINNDNEETIIKVKGTNLDYII